MSTDARRRSLIFPREHGAWGMLLVPLVTGAAVGLLDGGNWPALAPLTIVALSLFWMRTPLESWIGAAAIRARSDGELALVRNVVAILALVSAGAAIWLFWGFRNFHLLWIGAAAGAAFVVQAVVKRGWNRARTAPQIIGAAGLTSLAAAGYGAATGRLDAQAWTAWLANFLFAFNQIQYVHLRIEGARAASSKEKLLLGRGFLLGHVGLTVVLGLAAAAHLFPWWAAAAFVPVLVRGFSWFVAPPRPLAIYALGKQELALSIVFGILLVAGFRT